MAAPPDSPANSSANAKSSASKKTEGRSVSTTQHHVTESAVLASEIEQLPDLQGYLKFASTPEWRGVKLQVIEYADNQAVLLDHHEAAPGHSAGLKSLPALPL